MEKTIDAALQQIKEAHASLSHKRDGISRRIDEITAKIKELRSAPVSLDDWSVFLLEHIRRIGDRWPDERFMKAAFTPAGAYGHGETAPNKASWENFESDRGAFRDALPFTAGRMLVSNESSVNADNDMTALCAIMPEQVHAAMMKKIKSRYANNWGNNDLMPVKERRTLIASLLREQNGLNKERKTLQAEIDKMTNLTPLQ